MSINQWALVGNSQSYIFIDQSEDGTKIIAATLTNIYYSTDSGSTWDIASITGMDGTITGISISGDGSIAYACTTRRVFSSTNLSLWAVSSIFFSIGTKSYTCIAVSNKTSTGTGTPKLVYAGKNEQGLYGLLSNGTSAVLLNNGNTSISWLCVSLCKTYTTTLIIIGCSSSTVYTFNTNINSSTSFTSNAQANINKVVITQSTDSIYDIFGIYSGTSSIKRSRNNITSFTDLANTSGKTWRDISSRTKYDNQVTSFVACTTSNSDYLYTYFFSSLSQRNIQADWLAVNGTSTTGSILYGIQNTSAFISQSTNGGLSCFIENTQILTNNGYKNIQDLSTNDKIYTTEGYFNLKYLGFNYINIVFFDKIYVYKNDFKDLYVMEGHSFLFKNTENLFNENYDEKIYLQMGSLIVDKYIKILAKDLIYCSIAKYEDIKNLVNQNHVKYYHIVLDNNNDEKQYAIYANSILTETMCEKYFLNNSELHKI